MSVHEGSKKTQRALKIEGDFICAQIRAVLDTDYRFMHYHITTRSYPQPDGSWQVVVRFKSHQVQEADLRAALLGFDEGTSDTDHPTSTRIHDSNKQPVVLIFAEYGGITPSVHGFLPRKVRSADDIPLDELALSELLPHFPQSKR